MQKKQLILKLVKGQQETLKLASVISDYYFKKFSKRLFDIESVQELEEIDLAKVMKNGREIMLLDPVLSDSEKKEIQSLPDSDLIKLLRDVNITFLRMDKSLSSTAQL